MSADRDTAKFEGLNLESGWVEAAGHVDYQLSSPAVSLSKSALGATWRGLDPVTQRSYIVVAVKKSQACLKSKRMLSFAERYMTLMRYICELLWVASSNDLKIKRPAPKKATKSDVTPFTVAEAKIAVPAFAGINSDTTATVLPRSPAWYNLTKGESLASRRFDERAIACICTPPCRSPRVPISPLARYVPLSADDLKNEDGYFAESHHTSCEELEVSELVY